MYLWLRLLALTVAMALASCASHPKLTPGPHLTVADATELPPPTGEGPGPKAPYVVAPYDKLTISVFGVEELSRPVTVDASGRISLPLAGTIEASGKSTVALAQEIAQRLRGQYVRDPQVAVNLEETFSQLVTVDGEVRQPGLYPVNGNMTLMRAVARANGATEFAELKDVVVFRKVGQQDMAALYNLGAVRRGLYPDPPIFANDVIVVGNSPSRRLFRDIVGVLPVLYTPIIAFLAR